MLAIGFIETLGMLPAIEAADAMLKAAYVRLLEKNLVGSGLVTVTVSGEVSAVQASVDAAVASISRIEGARLVSRHVIARPDQEISNILVTSPPSVNNDQKIETASPVQEARPQEARPQEARPQEQTETPVSENSQEVRQPQELAGKGQLKKMSLNKLRELALATQGIDLSPEDIALATKNTLIHRILNAYRQL